MTSNYLIHDGTAAHMVQCLKLLVEISNEWELLQPIFDLPRLHVELLLLFVIHRRHLGHDALDNVGILGIDLPKILLLVVVAVMVFLY